MEWKRGDKSKLATLAGISKQYLNAILKRKKRCNPSTALKLEKAAKEMDLAISANDLVFNKETNNSLFG
jgi:DNA-binding transcriptional regulator YdaS (Cro superfamily)